MESNIFQQLQAIEQQLLAKKGVQVHIHISFSPGSTGLSESDVQQLINDVDSMCEKEAAGPKTESVTMEFIHDRPNRIGIWAYKTSTEFSDGRLAYTVVDDVSKCNVVPSPGCWAYVGDHR